MRIPIVLSMVAALAAIVAAPMPAAANDTCPNWFNDQAIANTTNSACRATFVVDVGSGNHMSRQELWAARDLYRDEHFSDNFLWYSYEQDYFVPNTNVQRWSHCEGSLPRGPGHACGGSIGDGLM